LGARWRQPVAARIGASAERSSARKLEDVMIGTLKKTAIAAVAALTLTAGLAGAGSAPAAAAGSSEWNRGGLYGSHPSYPSGRNWRSDRDRGGFGPAVGLGIVGGAIAGAAIANSYGYDGGGYYGDPCWRPQPTYDAWGRFVGNQLVNVCD
jgi:hypothetical protein